MGRILAIDRGNTRAKLSLFDNSDTPVLTCGCDTLSIEELLPLVEKENVEGAIYSSVSHVDAKLIESLRHILDDNVLTFTHATPVPMKIFYRNSRTLGTDRVAAAVGAATLYPGEPLLVVDAGTAITADIVDGTPAFRGGNISPGMALRFRSLNDHTGRLPLLDYDGSGSVPPFGDDTRSAIEAGVMNGITAEIKEYAREASRLFGCRTAVLTGGDAPLLMPLIKDAATDFVCNPHLLATGLNRIYRYNETL